MPGHDRGIDADDEQAHAADCQHQVAEAAAEFGLAQLDGDVTAGQA
jgi:hypothetical protein